MKGYIFDIKHFAIHDGPGIRTTVFFKGCPLKCIWCHNPEGILREQQVGYIDHKCINCGRCATVCPTGAHRMTEDRFHIFDREKCVFCMTCQENCSSKSLILYGKHIDAETVIDELLEDRDFYSSSNGGITLSGGECLMQADFCKYILEKLKKENIHTAVDTCGFVSKDALRKVMPYTDLFLYDLKAYDEDVHVKCTGQSNRIILENLAYLDENGSKIEIRIPLVPEYNITQVSKIGKYLSYLKNIVGVRILPYHNFAGSKYKAIGMKNTLPERLPSNEEINTAEEMIASFNLTLLK